MVRFRSHAWALVFRYPVHEDEAKNQASGRRTKGDEANGREIEFERRRVPVPHVRARKFCLPMSSLGASRVYLGANLLSGGRRNTLSANAELSSLRHALGARRGAHKKHRQVTVELLEVRVFLALFASSDE